MSLASKISAAMDTTWSDETVLHYQDELSEISLPDFAKTLCVRTYLQMCGLKYRSDRRSNAEFLSPTGKVPVLRQNNFMLTTFNEIVSYVDVKKRGLPLTSLNEAAVADMNAFCALVQNVLGNSELYMAWMDPVVANEVTKPRYGSVYSWPLDTILPLVKQREMKKILSCKGWAEYTTDEVCDQVRKCCQALSIKLATKKYFFGDELTALDAVVFGHLFAIVTTVLPNNCLHNVIKDFGNLQEFLRRVNENCFGDTLASPQITSRS